MSERKRVLFTGYAPVHFVCFLPVYQSLLDDPSVELWLSGGFKRELDEDRVEFELDGFYDSFPVDRQRVIPIERARQESFDVLVCAHLSDSLFPGAAARTVQIFHGVSFKNLLVRERALRFDVLCLPGRYHAELYQRQGLIRPDGPRCFLTGYAKTDPLARRESDRAVLRALELDPSRPTILFAPTGEKRNALEIHGVEAILAIKKTRRFNLLIKPHDHPKRKIDWFSELTSLEDDRTRLVRALDVVPFLDAADLLITDASSVAFEYTLVDRPIVFLDVPRMLEKVQKRAPSLDLETYGRKIGVVVPGPDELVAAIDDSLAHPEREGPIRRRAAEHIFYRPGGATRRVAGMVRWAAGLADPPADAEPVAPTSSTP
ncbi:MAG TPA: CDP-glycerol glycerophosphotransferase family protein [Kofleriaceae bacterium]|nr:CDP-glycerol glycerophosphotransferase family protein [Kofleriaceae bacterium]